MGAYKVEGLKEVVAEFALAEKNTLPEVTKVISKGALNIKNDWRKGITGLKHAPRLPYALGYDIGAGLASVSATIGPDKNKRQGSLGNLVEFGSVNNPPNPAGQRALDREAPKFEAALIAATKKLLP